jgi:biopolymer transport protein ExbD
MKLARRPRRESPETIVALIDVVFFLLVFFLLIGRMDATAPFQVTPPLAVTGSDLPGGGATVAVSATGDLALNGSPADRAKVLSGIANALTKTPALLIRVNAHRDAELRHLLPLVAEIEALGATDIVLVVTPGLP